MTGLASTMAGLSSLTNDSPSAFDMVDDSQNWLRINLIVDFCLTDMMLTVLHNRNKDSKFKGLPEDGVHLYNRMQAFRIKYEKLLKKVIREEQWNIICPSSGDSNSENWDITTIKVVAQYEVLQAPLAGWENDPIPIDESVAADVCRATNIRNYVKHSTPKTFKDTKVYNNTLSRIITVLERLGYDNMKLLNDLATGSLMFRGHAILKVLQQKISDTNNQVETLEDAMCGATEERKDCRSEMENLQCEVGDIKVCIKDIANEVNIHQSEMQQLMQHFDKVHQKLIKLEPLMTKVEQNKHDIEANRVGIEELQGGINPDEMVLERCLEIVAEHIGDQWELLARKLHLRKDGTSSEQTSQVNMEKCFENVSGEITWQRLKSCLRRMEQEKLLQKLMNETNLTYGISEAIEQLRVKQLRVKNQSTETNGSHHIYIDLAVVQETEYNDNYSEHENYILQMSAAKQTISLDKVVQSDEDFVFVTGNAGIGKSELTEKIVSNWAKGELFNGENGMPKIELLFFLKCRELNTVEFLPTDEIETMLKKLFPEVFRCVSMEDFRDICHKTMFIVDGLDELMSIKQLDRPAFIANQRIQKMVQFVRDVLFSSTMLFHPEYRVAVGRPHIVSLIKKNRKSKVVYVCGFNSKSIDRYIETYCDEKLQQKVKAELKRSQNLSAISHVPVYLSVICSIYKEELVISTPRTAIELMIYACLAFIRKHLIDHNPNVEDVKNLTLRQLCDRRDLMTLIKCISRMSFKSLHESKVLFVNEDLDNEIIHNIDELEKKTGFIVTSSNEELGILYRFSHLVLHELFCGFHMFFTPKEELDIICRNETDLQFWIILNKQEETATHLESCFAVVACVEGVIHQRTNNLLTQLLKQLSNAYEVDLLTNKSLMVKLHKAFKEDVSSAMETTKYIRYVFESNCKLPSSVKKLIKRKGTKEMSVHDNLEIRWKVHFYKQLELSKISFNSFNVVCPINDLSEDDMEGLAYLLSKTNIHTYDVKYKPIYKILLPQLERQRIKLEGIRLKHSLVNPAREKLLLKILPHVEKLFTQHLSDEIINTLKDRFKHLQIQTQDLSLKESNFDFVCDRFMHETTLALYFDQPSLVYCLLDNVKRLKECDKLKLTKITLLSWNLSVSDVAQFVNFIKYVPTVCLHEKFHYTLEAVFSEYLDNLEILIHKLISHIETQQNLMGELQIYIEITNNISESTIKQAQNIINKLKLVFNRQVSFIVDIIINGLTVFRCE